MRTGSSCVRCAGAVIFFFVTACEFHVHGPSDSAGLPADDGFMKANADGCGSEFECSRLERDAKERREKYCRPDPTAEACKVADSDLLRVQVFIKKTPWRIEQDQREARERALPRADPTPSIDLAAADRAEVERLASVKATAEALEVSCAADRTERLAIRARNAAADSAAAAERAKKAAEAGARAEYIMRNCRTLMTPSGPPQACVDDEGYYRDCSAVPEVYIQCPANGPKGLRGVIGSAPITMATGDPSRVARVVQNSRSPGSTRGQPRLSEPTKDELCADLDRALMQADLVKRIQDAGAPAAAAPTAP